MRILIVRTRWTTPGALRKGHLIEKLEKGSSPAVAPCGERDANGWFAGLEGLCRGSLILKNQCLL